MGSDVTHTGKHKCS